MNGWMNAQKCLSDWKQYFQGITRWNINWLSRLSQTWVSGFKGQLIYFRTSTNTTKYGLSNWSVLNFLWFENCTNKCKMNRKMQALSWFSPGNVNSIQKSPGSALNREPSTGVFPQGGFSTPQKRPSGTHVGWKGVPWWHRWSERPC